MIKSIWEEEFAENLRVLPSFTGEKVLRGGNLVMTTRHTARMYFSWPVRIIVRYTNITYLNGINKDDQVQTSLRLSKEVFNYIFANFLVQALPTPPKEDTNYPTFCQDAYYQGEGGLPIHHCLLGSRIPGQVLLISTCLPFL